MLTGLEVFERNGGAAQRRRGGEKNRRDRKRGERGEQQKVS
jgi:hypothetical protein